MSWRMDSDGSAIWETMSPDDIACRDEEIKWMDDRSKPWRLINGIIDSLSRPWKQIQNELAAAGDPTALAGGFAGLELTPNVLTVPTATILTTEVAMWSTPTFTPIAANPQCPKAYMLRSWGYATTAATQGTMAFNMRLGQLITSPLLGSSVTGAQTASQTTTNWRLEGDVILRTGGGATTGAATGQFRYSQATATTAGGPELAAMSQIIGNGSTVTAYQSDAALANGLWPGAIAVTSTTNTFVPLGVIWASWN